MIYKTRFPRQCPKCGGRMVKQGFNSCHHQVWVCKVRHQTVNPIVIRPDKSNKTQ